jgi:hypothetical protein
VPVLALVAEPDVTADFARSIERGLERELAARAAQDGGPWDVRIVEESFTFGEVLPQLIEATRARMEREGWDLVIGLTDLPLRGGGRPLVADVSAGDRAALVSLPALGGWRLRRRATRFVERLVAAMVGVGEDLRDVLGRRRGPVRAVETDDDVLDARFVASAVRGRLRLLAGMVAANRPWRLVPSLSSALAAALATSAFGIVTNTIWQLADRLGWVRLTMTTIAAVGLMVGWLIVAHGLWERARGRSREEREKVALYNATTIATLGVGVLCGYAALLLLDFLAALFVIDSGLLGEELGHHAGIQDYLDLAWMTASASLIGGAVGSGLESADDVARAAYGQRERQRRAAHVEGADTD